MRKLVQVLLLGLSSALWDTHIVPINDNKSCVCRFEGRIGLTVSTQQNELQLWQDLSLIWVGTVTFLFSVSEPKLCCLTDTALLTFHCNVRNVQAQRCGWSCRWTCSFPETSLGSSMPTFLGRGMRQSCQNNENINVVNKPEDSVKSYIGHPGWQVNFISV